MKHLLKTALCLLLCALLSLPALAEEGEELTCGDYTYVLLEDGGARITGYDGEDAELTVPDELDGHAVREIGDSAFSLCESLTTVTLPDGLTTIGDAAFYICGSLTTVTLPDSLTSIGDFAFDSCSSLTTVTLPDSLTSIGDFAFYNCNSLTAVALPDSLTSIGENPFCGCDLLAKIDVSPDNPVFAQIDGVLYEKATKTLICYPAGKADDSFAVPEGTLAIGDDAFAGCFSLTAVAMPEGLTSIGEGAFVGCFFLRTIALPDSLTTIGDSAFVGCFALSAVALPEGLTSIGEGAFDGCLDTFTLTVPRDSYAHQYAIDNGIPYTCSDANG